MFTIKVVGVDEGDTVFYETSQALVFTPDSESFPAEWRLAGDQFARAAIQYYTDHEPKLRSIGNDETAYIMNRYGKTVEII